MVRNILVAIPNHPNSLKGEMADSLLTAGIEATKAGWGFETKRLTGGYHHFARNSLLGYFHANRQYTDLVWWDDDVAITPGAFLPFVSHDVDFVCAPYRHKRDIESYPGELTSVEDRKMHESASTKTPLFNSIYWAIGFSRQSRACIDKMLADPDLRWADDELTGVKVPYVFKDEGLGLSTLTEDYVYCRRWIDLGGEVWIDPLMMTGHSGNQCWWGRFGSVLVQNVEQYRLAKAMERAA